MNNNSFQPIQSIYFIRQSPFILFSKLITLEIIFIALYLLFRLPKFFILDMLTQDILIGWSFIGVLFFIGVSIIQLITMLVITLSWTNEYYIIQPKGILHRKGIVTLKEETFSLNNVETFTVDQTTIGKIFNFGTIKFYRPLLKQEYYLTNVPNPVKLKNKIEKSVHSIKEMSSKNDNEMIIPLSNR